MRPFVNPADLRLDRRHAYGGVVYLEMGAAEGGRAGIRQWRRGRHTRFAPGKMGADCREGDHPYVEAWEAGYDLPEIPGVHLVACSACGMLDPLSLDAAMAARPPIRPSLARRLRSLAGA